MRFDWADNIRFIATVSAIIVHTAATGCYLFNQVTPFQWWIANIFSSGLRFALPFFFLLSGALNLSLNYDTPTFYKKRFFRSLLPFLFWGILFSTAFFTYYLIENRPASIFLLLKDFMLYQGVFRAQQYHLWFVYVLIGIYLLTPFIKIFTKNLNRNKIFIFGIIWISVLILNTLNIDNVFLFNLLRFAGYTGYYIAGYILIKTDKEIRWKAPLIAVIILTVIFMAITTYIFTKSDGVLNEYFCQTASITVFLSSFWLYRLLSYKKFDNKIFVKIRDEINRYGLGIYIIHASVLSLIEMTGIDWNFIHPLIGIPVTSIICIFVSYNVIRFMHKIPLIKYVAG